MQLYFHWEQLFHAHICCALYNLSWWDPAVLNGKVPLLRQFFSILSRGCIYFGKQEILGWGKSSSPRGGSDDDSLELWSDQGDQQLRVMAPQFQHHYSIWPQSIPHYPVNNKLNVFKVANCSVFKRKYSTWHDAWKLFIHKNFLSLEELHHVKHRTRLVDLSRWYLPTWLLKGSPYSAYLSKWVIFWTLIGRRDECLFSNKPVICIHCKSVQDDLCDKPSFLIWLQYRKTWGDWHPG